LVVTSEWGAARCFARREEAQLKTQETYERKVIEKVASSRHEIARVRGSVAASRTR
jgi:hypothetical protein